MTHLTRPRLEALLEGSLPAEERRALARHLATGCEICAALLAEEPEGEGPGGGAGLDLDTLARLIAAEEAPAQAPPLPVRVATWRAVQGKLPRPARTRPWVAAALALAAAILLVVIARPPSPELRTPKGDTLLPAPVVLRVVAGQERGGRLEPGRRLSEGDTVHPGDTLLFEVQTGAPAAFALWLVDAAGTLTVLDPPQGPAPVLPAGRHALTRGGQWVAFDVDPQPGPLTIVAAAAPTARDPRLGLALPWQQGRLDPAVATATLTLQVAP